MGVGQHVWPSQEMVLNIPDGEKSRILFKLNDCAAMHSEKIGNALRTIDTWYGAEAGRLRPIAIEPYGSVTSRGEAYRKTNNDFYTLLGKWLENSEDVQEKQQHFIIATLIRGGVFGGKDD
jgi:CRISPR-associated protein Csy3